MFEPEDVCVVKKKKTEWRKRRNVPAQLDWLQDGEVVIVIGPHFFTNCVTCMTRHSVIPVMKCDIGVKVCDGPSGKRVNQPGPFDNGAKGLVDGFVPIEGCGFK